MVLMTGAKARMIVSRSPACAASSGDVSIPASSLLSGSPFGDKCAPFYTSGLGDKPLPVELHAPFRGASGFPRCDAACEALECSARERLREQIQDGGIDLTRRCRLQRGARIECVRTEHEKYSAGQRNESG